MKRQDRNPPLDAKTMSDAVAQILAAYRALDDPHHPWHRRYRWLCRHGGFLMRQQSHPKSKEAAQQTGQAFLRTWDLQRRLRARAVQVHTPGKHGIITHVL